MDEPSLARMLNKGDLAPAHTDIWHHNRAVGGSTDDVLRSGETPATSHRKARVGIVEHELERGHRAAFSVLQSSLGPLCLLSRRMHFPCRT
eukprot:6499681-Prymnesium_polylepis.2